MTNNISPAEMDADLDKAIDKAKALSEAKDLQACVNHCLQSLTQFGEQSAFLKVLGTLAFNQGDMKHAQEFYIRITNAFPGDAIGWAGLGMVYGASDQTDKAIFALEKSVSLKPENPAPYLNLAIALMKAQRIGEAKDILEPAAQSFPEFSPLHAWLGHAYSALDQITEAISAYNIVNSLNPDDISVMLPLALLERDRGDIEASSVCLARILEAIPGHPVARFTQSQNLLISGKLEEGFAEYECRWEREGMARPNLKSKLWQGEPLSGKSILVYAEQGFGDSIQFVRFLPMLKEQGAEVHLKIHPRLHKLLATVGGIDKLISLENEDRADFNVAMMSLPHHLKTTLDSIPAAVPYLGADRDLVRRWQQKLEALAGDKKLKVGLVWQGDPNSQSEKGRSVPFGELTSLFDLPDIHFFLIQKQDGLDQLADISLPDDVTDIGADLDLGEDAFTDTAAMMTCLDLVISSDTSPAHLSGALACKTWIILKYVPEWRWMLNRADSPWYPTAKLFRQKTIGDWAGVVQEIKVNLKELATI